MENQVSPKNIILNYGLFFGLGLVFTSLIMYATGNLLNPSAGIFSLIATSLIVIGVIILGIKKYKQLNNTFLTFGQAVKIGVGIAVIGGIISIIYQQVFENFIAPEIVEQRLTLMQEALENSGMSEEQIETQLSIQQKMSNPLITSAIAILFWAFIGFVISAIGGAIMQKREEDTF